MSWRTTRSARSSNSVGSRLMMTRARAVALGHQRKSRRRPHHQRRADGEKQIAIAGQLLGPLHRRGRHRLPERHGGGLDVAAAGAIGRVLAGGLEFFAEPTAIRSADRIPGTRRRWYCRAIRRRRRARCRKPDAGCRCSASPAPAPCRRDRGSPAPDVPVPASPWRNCSSMTKRRRQASSRISLLAMKASNGIGWFLVHNPPGERKSGMPHSVEIPAPVNGDDSPRVLDRERAAAGSLSQDRAQSLLYESYGQAAHRS